MKRSFFILVLALGVATSLMAQTPWVHVEVQESGEESTHVNVNLPLSVVQVAIDVAPDKFISDGQIHLNHIDHDLDIEDLRAVWKELRATGDAELVTVESDDETVRIRREGDFIRIDVDERKAERSEPERVHIEVPVRVVDALFSGEGESLNLEHALAELSNERGDIVRVDKGEAKIRIWIDEGN